MNTKQLITLCLGCVLPMTLVGCKSKKNSPEVETDKVSVVIRGHEYDYDVVTGATLGAKDFDSIPMTREEKLSRMFWSPKPAVGFIKGDYYHGEKTFNERHLALIDVVKDGDKIVHIEMDEVNPAHYYSPDWAGAYKRYSGYAFFQADGRKTERTLVTLVNGMTYLEHQMLTHNRLDGNFKQVKGASNSLVRAFLPLAAEMAQQISEPSGQYYYGLVKDLGDGILARLEVVAQGEKIIQVRYDEIFGDTEESIADEKLKQFYRQSKYYSKDYPTLVGNFKAFSDKLNAGIVASQDLRQLPQDIDENQEFATDLKNYMALAEELSQHMGK